MSEEHVVSGYWEVQTRARHSDYWYRRDDLTSYRQSDMGAMLWQALQERIADRAQRRGGFGPLSQPGIPTPPLVQTILKTRCLNARPDEEVEFDGHRWRFTLVEVRG